MRSITLNCNGVDTHKECPFNDGKCGIHCPLFVIVEATQTKPQHVEICCGCQPILYGLKYDSENMR